MGIVTKELIIGNLSTAINTKVMGSINPMVAMFPIWDSFTIANNFLENMPIASEWWGVINSSEHATLAERGVLPGSGGGIMHCLRSGTNTRSLVELYQESSIYIHFANEVSALSNKWYKYEGALVN